MPQFNCGSKSRSGYRTVPSGELSATFHRVLTQETHSNQETLTISTTTGRGGIIQDVSRRKKKRKGLRFNHERCHSLWYNTLTLIPTGRPAAADVWNIGDVFTHLAEKNSRVANLSSHPAVDNEWLAFNVMLEAAWEERESAPPPTPRWQ